MTTPPPPPSSDPLRALRDVLGEVIRDGVKQTQQRSGSVSEPLLGYVKTHANSILDDVAQRVKTWYEEQHPGEDSTWQDNTDAPIPIRALRTPMGDTFDPELREAVANAIRRYPNDAAEGWTGPEAVLREVENHLYKNAF